jgi:hypothetical protein
MRYRSQLNEISFFIYFISMSYTLLTDGVNKKDDKKDRKDDTKPTKFTQTTTPSTTPSIHTYCGYCWEIDCDHFIVTVNKIIKKGILSDTISYKLDIESSIWTEDESVDTNSLENIHFSKPAKWPVYITSCLIEFPNYMKIVSVNHTCPRKHCKDCKGSGKHKNEKIIKCIDCDGTGGVTCTGCYARGFVTGYRTNHTCDKCHGCTFSHICKTCKGARAILHITNTETDCDKCHVITAVVRLDKSDKLDKLDSKKIN